ncbi:short-chain dehydrogenase/reductase [Maudiozyma humilis]|uniref:Short-chain dehydrogenase/reductase n=1 Tax=Maudiozyma humilis TaxID=51915 RepID=A0AAV5RR12_MAUHU|nr:short-chain dehydrogenase/reductase [Kazachstania humilis]
MVSPERRPFNSNDISCPIVRTALCYFNPITVQRKLEDWNIVDNIKDNIFNEDAICLITGGSNGLGLEVVKLLVDKTCKYVIIVDIIAPPEVYLNNSKVRYLKCDLSDSKQIRDTYQKIIRTYKGVSILINNAGRVYIQTLFRSTDSQIDDIMKVNFLGPYQLTSLLLPHMLEKGFGCIVNVASVLGEITPARLTVYGASKASFLAFHRSLSTHLSQFRNSTINTILVCPGKLETKMFEKVRSPSQIIAPDVNPSRLAVKIVDAIQQSKSSTIRLPYYANLLPLYTRLEWPYVFWIKILSGMNKVTAV